MLLLLMACIPAPHMQQRNPELHGVVTRNGTPVVGAPVTLAVNPASDACEADAHATTAADGSFMLPSFSERELAFVFGDRKDFWRVCIDLPDEPDVVWEGDGYWGGPPRVDLTCDPAGCTAR